MTLLSKFDMSEATRLTREGKLQEALAVLKGALTGHGTSSKTHDNAGTQTNGSIRPLEILRPFLKIGNGLTAPSFDAGSSIFSRDNLFVGSTKNARSPLVKGAIFDERSFANAAGTRAYKLYVPSRYDGRPLPLVVMLHGCTQSPDDFAAGTRMNEIAEEQNFIVAYPAQSQSANSSKCWNWFNGRDQQRGHGEASLIAGITTEIMSAFPIDASRVYVVGMSAGGAAAAIMGNTYPDLYAAIGIHSGLPCGAAKDVTSAFAAMKHGSKALKDAPCFEKNIVPTIVFHGDADTTVNSVNGDDIIAQAQHGQKTLEVTVSRGQSAGGMPYTRILQTDASGQPILEQWRLHGAGHAWSGGSPTGSFTDPTGPDASREMIRFFLSTAR